MKKQYRQPIETEFNDFIFDLMWREQLSSYFLDILFDEKIESVYDIFVESLNEAEG